jgi:Holliday junction resolvase
MARRAARIDDNQPEIVRALRAVGATVEVSSAVGGGFPDLVCGYRGNTYLLEVKDGKKPPSKRKLTPDQVEWHDRWRGQVAIVKSINEALNVIGAIKQEK